MPTPASDADDPAAVLLADHCQRRLTAVPGWRSSTNCMYTGEYSRRWRFPGPHGWVPPVLSNMAASSLSRRQPNPASSLPASNKNPSQEAKDERLNFRANERLAGILAQLKDEYGITMSESIS